MPAFEFALGDLVFKGFAETLSTATEALPFALFSSVQDSSPFLPPSTLGTDSMRLDGSGGSDLISRVGTVADAF